MKQKLIFDAELLRRYNTSGPRYTSYPTANEFSDKFDAAAYRRIVKESNISETSIPLSLYFHIPFCDTLCFYCGCNKIATKNRTHAIDYLDHLYKEISMQGQLFDRDRWVDQLHWGGGTPTFINHEQMARLMEETRKHFRLREDDTGEYSIEIDPREVQEDTISFLRQLGFNRMSMGVQDFDERVQRAVNRIQSEEQTMKVLTQAKSNGFKSVSIDLIYGLPFQTERSFEITVNKIISADPDRVSLFNYAHLPEIFKPQRRINVGDLPSPEEKLNILEMSIERLTHAGYVYIGMDHFAKPGDELAVAQRQGSLYRNFQGYSTHAQCDMVAMGVTSISMVGNSYGQNHKDLAAYYEMLDNDELPLMRGLALSPDDVLRRVVITQLICLFELDKSKIEASFNIKFDDYFSEELQALKQLEVDGLVSVTKEMISVMPSGRLLIRNICMVFDNYLKHSKMKQRFSKVI